MISRPNQHTAAPSHFASSKPSTSAASIPPKARPSSSRDMDLHVVRVYVQVVAGGACRPRVAKPPDRRRTFADLC